MALRGAGPLRQRPGRALLCLAALTGVLHLARSLTGSASGQPQVPTVAWVQPPYRGNEGPSDEGVLQRRQALLLPAIGGLLPAVLGAATGAGAAEQAAVAATGTPAQADPLTAMLDPLFGGDFISQALNSTGLPPEAAASLGGNGGLLALAVVAGLLLTIFVPLLKFFIAAGSTLFFLQVADERFNNGTKSRRQGQGVLEKVLRRLSGEPEDELDSRRLEVKRLNDEFVGWQANIIEQADSVAAAQSHRDSRRAQRFRGIWEATISGLDLTEDERTKTNEAIRKYREEADTAIEELDQVRQKRRQGLFGKDDPMGPASTFFKRLEAMNKQERLYGLEEALLQDLSKALPKEKFDDLKTGLKKQDDLAWIAEGQGKTVSEGTGLDPPERIYVLRFAGDLTASRTEELSKEVSAILSAPGPPPKEVVLLLNSPGGSVTGYGLAGAQLLRFRERGVKLTVCVDELAASGGYLMACCADKILCSPFAAIGSIGVIAQIPNAARRLEKEGFNFIETTAGKWKRTVTPFKVPTEEELAKQKEDIGMVFKEFSGFVKRNRPSVTIDEVATGEVWYGPDALSRKLVDELKTSAQYLLECVESGAEVFSIRFKRKDEARTGLLAGASSQLLESLLRRELGQQQSGGLAESLQELAQRYLPGGLGGRGGPQLRAPEEQIAPQLLAEDFAGQAEEGPGSAARQRLLERLLAREFGL